MVSQLWLTCVTDKCEGENVAEGNRQGTAMLDLIFVIIHFAFIAIHLLTATPPSITMCLCSCPHSFFHPRPTFMVVVGVAIKHKTPCEEHKAKLGQILHAVPITLEDCTLCMLIAHPAHQICFVCPVGVFEPHISPVSYPAYQSWVTKKKVLKKNMTLLFVYSGEE